MITTSSTEPLITPAGTSRWSTRIGADAEGCRAIRDRLRDALEAHGWSEEDAFRVLVCADEALANAMTHGARDGGAIDVRCTVTASHATLVLADEGLSWTPAAEEPAVPGEDSEHGRGLILMRALADSVRIRRRPVGTLVALGFRVA